MPPDEPQSKKTLVWSFTLTVVALGALGTLKSPELRMMEPTYGEYHAADGLQATLTPSDVLCRKPAFLSP